MNKEGSHVIIYDANDNPLYEGWAIRTGADTSQAVWKMVKYIWVAGTSEQTMVEEAWADGNHLYDNIWDNRAALTYIQAV
jgi:hypothetical protein